MIWSECVGGAGRALESEEREEEEGGTGEGRKEKRDRKRKRRIKCGENVSNHRESRERGWECSLCYCLFILLLESEIFKIKT